MNRLKDFLSEKDPFVLTKWLLITFCAVIILFFAIDAFDLSKYIPVHLRFDWAYNLCTLVAAVASVTLCAVTLKQNETANNFNKRLHETNKENFKKSAIRDAYSLLHFHDNQFISEDGENLRINFKDERGLPLKSLKISQISFEYLNEQGTAVVGDKVLLKNSEEVYNLEYTPKKESRNDYYLVNIKLDNALPGLVENQIVRIGFRCELENFFGVKTSYNWFYVIAHPTGKKRLNMCILAKNHEFCYFDKFSCD